MGSAIPPCRQPFPRLRGVPAAGFDGHSQVADRTLSSSSAILWSFSQRDLASPPKRTSPSHGLFFPTAHSGIADPLTRALPARYVPPSGFGHPLDGLLPANPRRLYFRPTALLGFNPSELSPRERYPERCRPEAPTYCFARRCSHRRSDGADRRAAVSGLCPFRESLAAHRVFSTPTAGCSPGIRPSWVNQSTPWPGFRPASSHALGSRDDARHGYRCLRVSLGLDLDLSDYHASMAIR
jgi:hypothetical protein